MRTKSVYSVLFFILYFLCLTAHVAAQGRGQHKNKLVRKMQRNIWTAGISGIVIDDDASAYRNLFNVKETWNLLPLPTRGTFEGYIDHGLSLEGSLAYMRLNKFGYLAASDNGQPRPSITLLTFDASVKYDLNHMIGNTEAFSPYAIGGLGYTFRGLPDHKNAITGNFGLGFTIWIDRGIGLNAQSMAKFALNHAASKNYLMHSLGVVYRFNLIRGYITPDRLGHRRRH